MDRSRAIPIDSEALRANISRTTQPAVIPDRFQPILTEAVDFVGVHAALREILSEYFHPYRDAQTVVAGLGAMHLRYWPYLGRSAAAVAVFDLIAELTTEALRAGFCTEHFSALLRTTLMWCRQAVIGERAAELDTTVAELIETLSVFLDAHTTAFLSRDTVLRELLIAAPRRSAAGEATESLYRRLLQLGYRRLRERLNIAEWALSGEADLTDAKDVSRQFTELTPAALAGRLRELEHHTDLRADDVVSYSELLASASAGPSSCRNLEDRFAACLFLLKDDTMGHGQQQVLNDLISIVKELIQPGLATDIDVLLSRLTRFFRDRDDEFPQIRLTCYEVIGKAIGLAGDEQAADHLLEDILSWRFPYPEISGATDEWQTIVNPYHLPVIRCWLAIIESNPAIYERLAAALNVQLFCGGVHITDADLFQRDITRFLNCDIGDIYFVAKQLLRVFPVYFSEVGAEGELRATSTRLDEIGLRRDTLLHFLRKQVHAESSHRLVAFSAAVLRYWLTLDPIGLTSYISAGTAAAVAGEASYATGPHTLLKRLRTLAESTGAADTADDDAFVDWVLDLDQESLLEWGSVRTAHQSDAARLAALVRTHQLLRHKYSLTYENLAAEVNRFHRLTTVASENFTRAHRRWLDEPVARDALLDASVDVLEELRSIIVDLDPQEPNEQLYRKRHIAAGIPSVYGSYREPKFDALGLSLRVENLVARLLEDVVNEGVEPYLTLDSLRHICAVMQRFERTLAIDGIVSGNFSDCLRMLEASFTGYGFSFHQYQNVFAMLARAVSDLTARSMRSHSQILQQTLTSDPRLHQRGGLTIDGLAEVVLRDVLVGSLGIQTLDRFVGAVLRKMTDLGGFLDASDLTKMMNYDARRLVWPLHGDSRVGADLPTLGAKGYGLISMASAGLRIPEGFVLSTELFHVQSALSYRPMRDDTERRLQRALAQLEASAAQKFGSLDSPLLLSVRSGSPISMPGLMTTFVNVGLNEAITERMAARPGFAWAAWDSYRRFLQSWAMYEGVDRVVFDTIMNDAKRIHGVDLKLNFTPQQMQQVALSYKAAALDHAVTFVEDPFECLTACVLKVVASWDAACPRLYRENAHIADNWGTAVICQRMVFGNLGPESGSGVVFTANPLEPHHHRVQLFGDFAVGAQGEDLVGGLVFPLPISEVQRRASSTYGNTELSLETMFPDIYAGLLTVARSITGGPNTDPQEIEFTFESPSSRDLYLLQKRVIVQESPDDAPQIDTTSAGVAQPVAFAMGAAGGAYIGRIAITPHDVDRLSDEFPGEPIILVRPDTVPEDLMLLARVDGLLTARGGATSHAAVTAKRLGKTAVVGCHTLTVHDHHIALSETRVEVGEWVTIDGRAGNIYLGKLPLAVPRPPHGL